MDIIYMADCINMHHSACHLRKEIGLMFSIITFARICISFLPCLVVHETREKPLMLCVSERSSSNKNSTKKNKKPPPQQTKHNMFCGELNGAHH